MSIVTPTVINKFIKNLKGKLTKPGVPEDIPEQESPTNGPPVDATNQANLLKNFSRKASDMFDPVAIKYAMTAKTRGSFLKRGDYNFALPGTASLLLLNGINFADNYFVNRIIPHYEEDAELYEANPVELLPSKSASGLSDTKSMKSLFSDAGEILLEGLGNVLELEGPQ